jgi:hypothetical protein
MPLSSQADKPIRLSGTRLDFGQFLSTSARPLPRKSLPEFQIVGHLLIGASHGADRQRRAREVKFPVDFCGSLQRGLVNRHVRSSPTSQSPVTGVQR